MEQTTTDEISFYRRENEWMKHYYNIGKFDKSQPAETILLPRSIQVEGVIIMCYLLDKENE